MTEPSNVPTAPAESSTPAAPIPSGAGESRAARRAASRAAFMAGDPTPPPAADPAPEPVTPPAEAPAADEPAPSDVPADDKGGEETPAAAEAAVEAKEERPPLDMLQKQRKRHLDEVAKARAELEAERARLHEEIAPRLKQLESFEKLKARAKVDLPSVLAELGYTDEDFNLGARQTYEHYKALKGDAGSREAAARLIREREAREAQSAYEQRLEQLELLIAQRDQQAAVQEYIGLVAKSVTDETPLVGKLLQNDGEEARQQMSAIALEMFNEYGEPPTPEEVVVELEKREHARFMKRGIDPYSVLKTSAATAAAATKTMTQTAGETKTAPRTLSSDLGTPTKPRSARLSKEERRQETIRALESGRLG